MFEFYHPNNDVLNGGAPIPKSTFAASALAGQPSTGLDNKTMRADPGLTIYGNAPIGHFQPRTYEFTPNSTADAAEQKRETKFMIQQKKFNKELDAKLKICRC